jgi:linalool 8-monooxygenase
MDLKNPDTYATGVPYAALAELRRASPVCWNPETDGAGFWSVLRHADIAEVSRNPAVFSSAFEHGGHRIFNENEVAVANSGSSAIGIPFISTDAPLHREYRGIAQPGLSVARIRAMEERLSARLDSLLDAMAGQDGEFDFVQALAAPFPLVTLAELFGVPQTDSDRLYAWSNVMVGEDDPSIRPSQEEAARCFGEMIDYASWIYEDRKRAPRDDMLSMLANAELAGRPLSRADFLGSFVLLLVGGNETTRNSISHAMIAFTEARDQWAQLRADPGLAAAAAREIVRWASPVLHMRRTALVDTAIGGQAIRKGDKVVMWYCAGNRDESVYENPDDFVIGRDGPFHLGFGTGAHTCLGNRLAEVQIRLVFERLVQRFPDLHICGAGRRMRSNFINGLLSLPARLR